MAELTADVPPQVCWMRADFAYDGDPRYREERIPVLLHAVSSLQNQALGWWAMTDRGAMLGRFPIHAFCWRRDAPRVRHDDLELWDAMAYHVAVHVFDRFEGARVRYVRKDGTWQPGTYLFTVDWYGSALAESPGETGWKCAHVIACYDGNYALQPNNRMLWSDPSWVTRPYGPGSRPDYKVQTRSWKVEGVGTWRTEHAERWAYRIEEEGP